MKKLLPFLALTLLVACVDTTGLSAILMRGPHPSTDPNAVVAVAEFGDFQCPACRAAHEQITKQLIAKYGKQIRFDFMHFPLRSLHRYALDAAEASECSADQGKFWEFVDWNYEHQEDLSRDALSEWAKTLGLDVPLFERCMKSHIKRPAILEEYSKGQTLGVAGTPTYFVNGVQVQSDIGSLSQAIDEGLKAGKRKL